MKISTTEAPLCRNPKEGHSGVVEINRQQGICTVTVVGLLGGEMEEFSLELLGEPGAIERVP